MKFLSHAFSKHSWRSVDNMKISCKVPFSIVNHACVVSQTYRGMAVFIRTLTFSSFKGNDFNFQFFPVDYKIKISDITLSETIPLLGYKSVINIIHITDSVKSV